MNGPAAIIQYPFQGANENNGYRLFPAALEDDPLVYFHGTAEGNLEAIIGNGFAFARDLRSVSFALNSDLALRYASEARTDASPNGCVLAVRFNDLENVAVETSIVHVYRMNSHANCNRLLHRSGGLRVSVTTYPVGQINACRSRRPRRLQPVPRPRNAP